MLSMELKYSAVVLNIILHWNLSIPDTLGQIKLSSSFQSVNAQVVILDIAKYPGVSLYSNRVWRKP